LTRPKSTSGVGLQPERRRSAENEDGEAYMSEPHLRTEDEDEQEQENGTAELGELLELAEAAESGLRSFRKTLAGFLRQRRATGAAGGLYG